MAALIQPQHVVADDGVPFEPRGSDVAHAIHERLIAGHARRQRRLEQARADAAESIAAVEAAAAVRRRAHTETERRAIAMVDEFERRCDAEVDAQLAELAQEAAAEIARWHGHPAPAAAPVHSPLALVGSAVGVAPTAVVKDPNDHPGEFDAYFDEGAHRSFWHESDAVGAQREGRRWFGRLGVMALQVGFAFAGATACLLVLR